MLCLLIVCYRFYLLLLPGQECCSLGQQSEYQCLIQLPSLYACISSSTTSININPIIYIHYSNNHHINPSYIIYNTQTNMNSQSSLQLQQISKTIQLDHTHEPLYFSLVTNKLPNQLVILDSNSNSNYETNHSKHYYMAAYFYAKNNRTVSQGIFQGFCIVFGIRKSLGKGYYWTTQAHITAHSYSKLLFTKKTRPNKHQLLNQHVEFDKYLIDMMFALQYSQNYIFDQNQHQIKIHVSENQWRIPLKIQSQFWNQQHEIIKYVKTLAYLQNLQRQLKRNQIHYTHESKINNQLVSQKMEQQKSEEKETLQKRIVLLEKRLAKSQYQLSQITKQLQQTQLQVNFYKNQMTANENKFLKIIEDLKKDKQSHGHKKQDRPKITGEITVPDSLRQKLSIDLHSSYLPKFSITGSQIKYVGQDKQATQLLSKKIFGRPPHQSTMSSTLKIIHTRSKCLKIGLIDRQYANERSCWNYPHIAYLHGWGHTMIAGKEVERQCDFGSGDTVKMGVDFEKGYIKWIVNGNKGVKVHDEGVRKMLSTAVEWVGFIAMYDAGDVVQWGVGDGEGVIDKGN